MTAPTIRTLMLAVLLCIGPPVAAQPERAARIGDVMVYEAELRGQSRRYEETVTVTAITGSLITTRHERSDGSPPAEGVFGRDWSTVKSSAGMRYEPPTRPLQFPLEVGKSWESEYVVTAPLGSQFNGKMAARVVARERLSTPAGDLDTFKVEMKGRVATWAVNQTLWYAPALDRIVRQELQEDRAGGNHLLMELKSYRLAP